MNIPRIITDDMMYSSRTSVPTYTAPAVYETDEEILERLEMKFAIQEEMTRAVKRGDVNAMIISGPPGVGKSHGVEKVLQRHDLFADIANDSSLRKYEIIKGTMSGLGLYCKLHQYKDSKSIVVFDDCDSILLDDLSLNLLKAALDSSSKRMLSWHTDSRLLKEEGIPNTFEFKGGCIFITNIKFDHVKSKKLRDHLEALESRCHYLDLTIDTDREKMLHIQQVVNRGMLERYEFEDGVQAEIVEFVNTNKHRMRELSLRMILKVADLRKSMPKTWKQIAEMTCMRKT